MNVALSTIRRLEDRRALRTALPRPLMFRDALKNTDNLKTDIVERLSPKTATTSSLISLILIRLIWQSRRIVGD